MGRGHALSQSRLHSAESEPQADAGPLFPIAPPNVMLTHIDLHDP